MHLYKLGARVAAFAVAHGERNGIETCFCVDVCEAVCSAYGTCAISKVPCPRGDAGSGNVERTVGERPCLAQTSRRRIKTSIHRYAVLKVLLDITKIVGDGMDIIAIQPNIVGVYLVGIEVVDGRVLYVFVGIVSPIYAKVGEWVGTVVLERNGLAVGAVDKVKVQLI